MLHERDPLFTLISDKLHVREYVARKVGNDCLIPLLWKGENPELIPFAKLPFKFVIKTNHGCGYNIIVKDKTQFDQTKAKRQLNKWLGENFCQDKFLGTEWGYKNIRPTIIIESFIEENGNPPVDYKFYCFSGHVEILTLHFDRFEKHKTKAFHRNFEPFEFKYDFEQWNGEYQRPSTFGEMVQLAEILSEGFDFIRVDFYSVDNKIYFGELTPYPAGISSFRGLDLTSLDCVLGGKWK
jgi:hypothetical protein